MGHGITQGSSAVAKCLQEEVWDSPHEAEGFQEPDIGTWDRPPTPQVFAQERTVGLIVFPASCLSLLSFFHNRKHANVDNASASKAAKVSEDDVEKAKMEWANLQFSDDEGIDANEWFLKKITWYNTYNVYKVILPPLSVFYISYTICIIHSTSDFSHLVWSTRIYRRTYKTRHTHQGSAASRQPEFEMP